MSDVSKLSGYLNREAEIACEELTKSPSNSSAWRQLAESTLTALLCFNRRRQGEVSKITLNDYKSGTHSVQQGDLVDSLSPLERKLCAVIDRIEIVGKRNRIVPLLVTSTHKRWLNVLDKKSC